MPRLFLLALTLGATVAWAAPTAEDEATLAAALATLERGAHTPFPADLRIDSISRTGDAFIVELGGAFGPAVDEVVEELRRETLLGLLVAADVDAGLVVRVSDGRGGYRTLGLEAPPVVTAHPTPAPAGRVLKPLQLAFGGALSGKRIALSAGHGWLQNDSGWGTQRDRWAFDGCGNCRGIVEDFYSAEVYSRHVIPLLRAMGAEVVLVRDPDHSTSPDRVVDDGDDGYSETGDFSSGVGGWNGGHRVGAASDATFSFALAPEATGRKHVALRWLQGADRTSEAVVEVEHAGGRSLISIDQREHGGFWLDLGAFWFEAGSGRVIVSNASSGLLVADAARLGGGVFEPSDKPMWQMAAASYVPWAGAPTDVTRLGDVNIRPGYAEYVGADAYIALHGNAAGTSPSSATGTSTYRYSCKAYADGTRSTNVSDCDDPPGSKRLTELVHDSIVTRMRAQWDPAWVDRHARVANFGEMRGLSTMPGALIEAAFFDNLEPNGPAVADNRAMHDPRWRETLAEAIADGLAKYFNPEAGIPPARPEGLVARNLADGSLEVSWRPVPGAMGYRIQRIEDPRPGRDRAWSEGDPVIEPSVVLRDLEPGRTYAFRVAAANTNGEGFFSQAVVARFRGAHLVDAPAAEVLHVAAYDRRDAWVQAVDNDLSHAVEHAQALMGVTHADVYFDGALDEAVEDGTVSLDAYRVIDFAAGKDSTEHLAVSRPMQALLRAYVDAGGALIVSGEEIAWHLGNRSTHPDDRSFFNDVLGATYVADSAHAYDMEGADGTAFEGFAVRFDDGTGGVFEIFYPDVIAPAADASVAFTWPDGRAAALLNERVLFVGAPLAAVVPASVRAELFDRALQAVHANLPSGDTDFDGADDECERDAALDPLDARDGVLDLDGDGVSNADECRNGTDPASEPADAGTEPEPDAGDPPELDAGPAPPAGEVLAAVSRATRYPGCACGVGSPVSLLWLLGLGLLLSRRR